MAKTSNQVIVTKPNRKVSYPVAASTTLYEGCMFFINSSGYAVGTTGSGANRYGGIAKAGVDNSGGSAGDLYVTAISRDDLVELVGADFTIADVGKAIFATDNFTVSLAGGTLIGEVAEFVSATKVMVRQIQQNSLNGTAVIVPYIPTGAIQSLSGAGACNVTSFLTKWTTTGANAGTLANGTYIGQLKKIQQIVDGGDGTLTPTSLSGGTTITFADAGDYALLQWNGTAWVAIELGNDADGATAPVLA